MGNKYQSAYIEDNFESLTHKELNRFYILQKLKSFYLKKAINDGKLFYKKDIKQDFSKLLVISTETVKNNLISETQLEALTMKGEAEIRKIVDKQVLASFLEIAYSDYNKNFQTPIKSFQLEFEKEVNIKVENLINIKLNIDDNIENYRKKIIELSERDEDTIRAVIDEIKYLCEFKKVIIFMVVCNSVAELPKRDRKKLYEEKIKFKRTKERTIKGLKELNLLYDEVEKVEFRSSDDLGWHNYETTLRHYKKILFFTLQDRCKTGSKRAKEIVKILDYL